MKQKETEAYLKFEVGIKKINDALQIVTDTFDELNKEYGFITNETEPKPKEKPLTKKQMNELQDSLSKCRCEGNTLFLPDIKLGALPNYNEVKSALMKAGAKYVKNTFVFQTEAQPIIDKLMGGEKINIKKQFQAFFTPDKEADKAVKLANIKEGMTVLEPSAGQGALIFAIYRAFPYFCKGANDKPCVTVDYHELDEINQEVFSAKLEKLHPKENRTSFFGSDFLKRETHLKGLLYDRIIANPPFNKNQDIIHIRKMYDMLKPKGRMVSFCSKHFKNSNNKTETDFKNWLQKMNAQIIEVPAGAFKESGTMIETCIIVIDKK